jgi:putative peptide zinc metalloprotease protein
MIAKEHLSLSRHGFVDGVYHWLVHDPDQDEYFLLPEAEVDLLRRLASGSSSLGMNEMPLYQKLLGLGLLRQQAPPAGWSAAAMKALALPLFLRLPLIRPGQALGTLRPLCQMATSVPVLLVGALFVVAGWIALLPRAEALFAFDYQIAELPLFLILLFAAKISHELAHAAVATRYGLPVRAFGIAFLFFVPRFYTDCSDAWRLPPRQRAALAAAGVLWELFLSGLCAWVMVHSPVDSEAFRLARALFLVTTLNSLFFNGNIFMRFDGYHVLSALWGRPNLQETASQELKARFQSLFLGLPAAAPARPALAIYGLLAWLYRLFLYTSIVLALFAFGFKPLAYALAFLEVCLFILLPLGRAAAGTWKLRSRVGGRAWLPSLSLAALLLFLAAWPWSITRAAPAVLQNRDSQILHAPFEGEIERLVAEGGSVVPGQLVACLRSWTLLEEEQRLLRQEAEAEQRCAENRLVPALRGVWQARLEESRQGLAQLRQGLKNGELRAAAAGRLFWREPRQHCRANTALAEIHGGALGFDILVPAEHAEKLLAETAPRFALAASTAAEFPLPGRIESRGFPSPLPGHPLLSEAGGPLSSSGGICASPQVLCSVPASLPLPAGSSGVVLYQDRFSLLGWIGRRLLDSLIR